MLDKDKNMFCSYCDFTGMIHNQGFEELGQAALVPCPKCVAPKCKCGGVEPYYYYDGENVQPCPCRYINTKILRIMNLYGSCGIEKKFRWKTFHHFQAGNKLAEAAKNFAYDLVEKFPRNDRGLFLWGNPGTGKTLLSSIILTELIRKHAIPGKFIKISRNFFNLLRTTFNENSEMYGQSDKIEREISSVDILVIDDFGVQRNSEWEQETIYNLIDSRYENEKFTIITSNENPVKSLKELSGGRVLSRIREMCRIMELSGEDYRERGQ